MRAFWGSLMILVAASPPAWAGGVSSSTPPALTLHECYLLALQRSEEVAIQTELIRAAEGRFLQALAQALPRASFVASEKRQDGSGGSAFTLREIPERKFTFSQPLFSGFKEFAAIAGSREERKQRTAQRVRAEQLLLVDVVESVYVLRETAEDLQALQAIRQALAERLDELKQRQDIGRARSSEVASAQAQLRRVEAEIELVTGRLETSHHLLEFLTGLPSVDVVADTAEPLPMLGEASSYLAQVSNRPDVQAAESAWKVSRHEVTIARSGLWPSVDVQGDYYTKRVGVASGVDWDVLFTLNAPIFQGGGTVGKVKEAVSLARQTHLRFEATTREALREINDLYSQNVAAQRRYLSLKQAEEAAEDSFRLQVEDYRLNLVSNLDVLRELQALQDARRNLISATYEMKRLYWRLKTAVGETLP